jgi:Fe-S-cluster containining protein
MPLSQSDIDRINQLGYKTGNFAVKSHGGWQLKNSSGKCVFLSGSGCEIYAHRPEGCRLYPLVFDEEAGRCVKDDVCPYREEFRVTKDDEKRLSLLLRRLKQETRQ